MAATESRAVVEFIATAISGSTGMPAEGFHSVADESMAARIFIESA